ncbi:hypothetical protein [Tenacibaculum xiamenense]|uniref:hypothetical protein n=1 Tax=Tenacibaculum xiamenense TaxID=1261553 RepID=UPI0038938D35
MTKEEKATIHRDKLQAITNKIVEKHTCLFVKNTDKPSGFATGVFVKINEHHFIFTAGHVAENNISEIFIIINNEGRFINPGGEWVINKVEGEREDDRIDVVILKLDELSITEISKSYDFLEKTYLDDSHNDTTYPGYSLVGFPESRNRYNKYKGKLERELFQFNTTSVEGEDEDIYNKYEYDRSINILIIYEQKKVINILTGSKETGPNLQGMSGSGLWYTKMQKIPLDQNNVDKKLIGIFIESTMKNKKYWVATRIQVFLKLLKESFEIEI